MRPPEERAAWLDPLLPADGGWVLSGSVMNWGDRFIPRMGMVVFLHLDPTTRMARLRAREAERHGARIAPGGDMAATNAAFLEWAAAYDTAGPGQRSLAGHKAWLRDLPCQVLRLNAAVPPGRLLLAVRQVLGR
jgi:hypothetical protein